MIRTPDLPVRLPFLVLLLVIATTASGQEASTVDINELRRQDFLDTQKRQQLKEWIAQQAQRLTDEELLIEDKRAIRTLFRDVVRKEPVPNEYFKRRFAEAMVEVFAEPLRGGEPAGALMMAMILYDLNDILPTTSLDRKGVLNGLFHPLPAVKYWTAKVVRAMHRRIPDLPEASRKELLATLQAAGVEENNGEALRAIYQALDFSATVGKVPFSDALTKTLVDILKVRGERYATGAIPVSEGDVAALEAMAKLSGPMSEGAEAKLRTDYLTALGRMMGRIVDEYVNLLQADKQTQERAQPKIHSMLVLTRAIEREFRRFAEGEGASSSGLPNVFAKMESGDTDLLLLARNQWIGWPSAPPGVLSKKPFNVPVAAGYPELQERGRQTSTAPTQPTASPSGS